jgi:hypothetical protein
MNNSMTSSTFSGGRGNVGIPPVFDIEAEKSMSQERLPFTVRLVQDGQDLRKAVEIRQSAYARHMPTVAETLKEPEAVDHEDGVAVLLAESKMDGSPLGTARIQTNQFKPLAIEKSVVLPDWLKGKSLAHVSRLGIVQGHAGRLVKLMLFKGLFNYWQKHHIEWAVVAARTPLDRMYQQLLFQDVFPGQGFTPLAHMNNVPHRMMAFEVKTALQRWKRAAHPLTNFIFFTDHPDLDVSADSDGSLSRGSVARKPRSGHIRPVTSAV